MFTRELILYGLHNTGWFLFSLALIITACTLVVVLMRYERRLVPGRVGNLLMALRLLVLLVLLLTMLEPVLSWMRKQDTTGRIVVAIDLSESMGTEDRHATDAEKLRWARALGIIGNSEIDGRLDRWLADLDAGREPQWIADGESAELAAARRQNLQSVFEQIDGLSRKQIALRLTTQTTRPLIERLSEYGAVDIRVFAGRTAAADPTNLEQLVVTPPSSLVSQVSDLGQILDASISSSENQTVLGVVLMTDGRDNSDRDPIAAGARLAQISAPVFPVIIGTAARPKDLSVASLDYPQTVFRDDQAVLAATLNTAGFAGTEIRVVLEDEGDEQDDPETRVLMPDGETTRVEFPLDASRIGRREYTLRIDRQSGETRDDNNSQSFAVNVVDDQVRVLLLEGSARWEFRFLDNALTRDERVDVKRVVFEQPYLGVLPKPFFPRSLGLSEPPLSLADSPFAEPELIIIGDVAPEHLTEPVWKLLEQFVSESGGTLVLLAGKRDFPRSYRSPTLAGLLPVIGLREASFDGVDALGPPTERGMPLRLTPDGQRLPMFQLVNDPEQNDTIWSELPGHSWALMGTAKPGASVWVRGAGVDGADGLETERNSGIMVHQHYGFGQVLWIGIDSTWRWRHRVGDAYHHRFWGQVGRWAAENKAAAGNQFVRFGPSQADIEVGQDAVLLARWTQQFLQQHPDPQARAEIFRADAVDGTPPLSVLDLRAEPGRPLLFQATAVSLPVGRYRVRLVADGAELGAEPIETGLYVHEKTTLELSDLSANSDVLTRLAEVSQGRVFQPHELDDLAQMFQPPEQSLALRTETELWDHWLVLILFFALLTTEWVVRKLNGLP